MIFCPFFIDQVFFLFRVPHLHETGYLKEKTGSLQKSSSKKYTAKRDFCRI